MAGWFPAGRRRGTFLSLYGPLSLLVLFSIWAVGLILGFALVQQSLDLPLGGAVGDRLDFGDYAYFSGVTFFTLGYGDIVPSRPIGRALAVTETGIGFGYLAVVIGYLPVLYQAFSRREVTISLFDARAGSPPTAGTLLIRNARFGDLAVLSQFLSEWERWGAEVLESHLSFPVLSYYRSQHDNQSWLAALTAVLDASAILMAGLSGRARTQASFTFAMARHVVVDLCQTFQSPPIELPEDRLDAGAAAEPPRPARVGRSGTGRRSRGRCAGLIELRGMYEPFVHALAVRFLMPLPPVLPESETVDNWQTSAWMRRTRGLGHLAVAPTVRDEHED